MATITNFLAKPTPYLTPFPKLNSFTLNSFSYNLPNLFTKTPKLLLTNSNTTSPTSTPVLYATAKATATGSQPKKVESDERVQQVHSIAEFDEALKTAKNKLVVVEYAASHSYHSRKIYPFMVELSRTCGDVEFLLVMGDESESTKELCEREKIDKVPHFSFYKSMEKIHEEEGIGPDELVGDVLYYGDNHSAVVQLHCR